MPDHIHRELEGYLPPVAVAPEDNALIEQLAVDPNPAKIKAFLDAFADTRFEPYAAVTEPFGHRHGKTEAFTHFWTLRDGGEECVEPHERVIYGMTAQDQVKIFTAAQPPFSLVFIRQNPAGSHEVFALLLQQDGTVRPARSQRSDSFRDFVPLPPPEAKVLMTSAAHLVKHHSPGGCDTCVPGAATPVVRPNQYNQFTVPEVK